MLGKKTDPIQVSAVIASLNRVPYLMNTLRDCQKQKNMKKEIIVVDQTPRKSWNPNDLAWVKRNCRYYFRAKKGVSAARNFGIRKARGEIVLFLDDDVRFGPGLFQGHYLSHQKPKVGGVFGLILEKNETNKTKAVKNWEKRLEARRTSDKNFREILWAPSGNTSYKKKALNSSGSFDEKLRVYCEDADLAVRIRFGGYLLLFNPKASLLHLGAKQGGLEHRNTNKNPLNKWLRLQDISYYHWKHFQRFGLNSIIFQIWRTARQYLLNRKIFLLTTKDFLLFIRHWYEGFKLALNKH